MMSYTLQRVRKQYLDGTHRVKSPDETLVSVSPLMEEIGVEEVKDITSSDRIGIPCFSAFRPRAARGVSATTPERARILSRRKYRQ